MLKSGFGNETRNFCNSENPVNTDVFHGFRNFCEAKVPPLAKRLRTGVSAFRVPRFSQFCVKLVSLFAVLAVSVCSIPRFSLFRYFPF